MTQNRDLSALLDINAAADKVLAFSHGFDEDSFFADDRTQSAILHQLMIIGEAVKRLSSDFRAAHPEIRWTPMAVCATFSFMLMILSIWMRSGKQYQQTFPS